MTLIYYMGFEKGIMEKKMATLGPSKGIYRVIIGCILRSYPSYQDGISPSVLSEAA